jgi:hypothetical protein
MANDTTTVRDTQIGTGSSGTDGPKTAGDALGKMTGTRGVTGPGGDTRYDAGDADAGLAGGMAQVTGGKGNGSVADNAGSFKGFGGTSTGNGGEGRGEGGTGPTGGIGRTRGGSSTGAGVKGAEGRVDGGIPVDGDGGDAFTQGADGVGAAARAGGDAWTRGGNGNAAGGAAGRGFLRGGNGTGVAGGNADADGGTGTTNGIVTVGTVTAEKVSIGRNDKITELLGKLNTPQFGFSPALAAGLNNNVNTTTIGRIYYRIPDPGPGAAFTITGFDNPSDGRILIVQNSSTFQWTIANETVSVAANQIRTQTGNDVILNGHAMAVFVYSSADSRWMLVCVQDDASGVVDMLQWAATGNPNSNVDRFLNQWAALGSVLNSETLVSHILIPGPAGKVRTLRNARAEVTTAPGITPGLRFRLRKNGVDTAITFDIDGGALVGSDLVNSVTVSPGDYLTVRLIRDPTNIGGSANPGNMNFSVELY